jgi:NADPH-dependent curcumin reductase CurA
MSTKSNQLVLSERPQRGPVNDKTFRRETAQLPELKEGELRVRVDYVSIVSIVTVYQLRQVWIIALEADDNRTRHSGTG